MIIGNNNFDSLKKNNNPLNKPMVDINRKTYHTDVTDKDEMADKSFAMLEERYKNGLISLDEYTKECNKLNKLRQK